MSKLVNMKIGYSTSKFENEYYIHLNRQNLDRFNFLAIKLPEVLRMTVEAYKKTDLSLEYVQHSLVGIIMDEEIFPPGLLTKAVREYKSLNGPMYYFKDAEGEN